MSKDEVKGERQTGQTPSLLFIGGAAMLFIGLPVARAYISPETGSYLFRHYSPKEYAASPQNWSIAQDKRGVMYFGNTDGVIEFDGVTWRTLRLPNHSFVRSVSVDADGTVYVGAQGDFGFLKHQAFGEMQFVSLLDRIAGKSVPQFSDVWSVIPSPVGIYFSTREEIFRLNRDGTVRSWRPKRNFGEAFYVFGTLYVQSTGAGLMKLSGDELVPVGASRRFATEVITAAVEQGESAIVATNKDLYRLTRSGMEAVPFFTADADLAKSSIYSMQILPGGEIGVGTRNGGLFLLDPLGTVDRVISKELSLLPDNRVNFIYVDHQGGVWLAQQTGLTRFNPGLSLFGKENGLDGKVECMTRVDDSIYVGTLTGLFRMTSQRRGFHPQFERAEGIHTAVRTLIPYDSDLLAGTDQGVFLISGTKAKPVFQSARPVFGLSSSIKDHNRIYAARPFSIDILRRNGSEWVRVNSFEQRGEEFFRTVMEDTDGLLWTASNSKIYRLDIGGASVRAEEWIAPPGLVNIIRLSGHVLFTTSKGIRRYSRERHEIVADESLGVRYADGSRDVSNIFEDKAGDVWATGVGYHDLLIPDEGNYKQSVMPLLHSGIQKIYAMSIDDDGTAWAAGEDNVLHRWDRRLAGDPDRDFNVLTRRVQSGDNKNNIYNGSGALGAFRVPWRENKLSFEFAVPFYEDSNVVEYQVKVEGIDNNWSAWSHETKKEYNFLAEGSYQWRVRARSPHGTVSESALFFRVLPPWYRSWWVYSMGIAGSLFGVWGLIKQRRVARLQSDFVSAVSHEFRTPLTTLRSITELLTHERITDDRLRQQSYVHLERESSRLQRLVEDLLDFGKMESRTKLYSIEPHDLFSLVRTAVSEFREESMASGFEIVVSLGGRPAEVMADEKAIRIAIRNLLENAVKYSAECRTVRVVGAVFRDQAVVSIRDQGMGIELAEHKTIFRKFVRGTTAKKAGIMGTGIGLSMVRDIVGAMGGRIRLESTRGVGSTFTIILPLIRRSSKI